MHALDGLAVVPTKPGLHKHTELGMDSSWMVADMSKSFKICTSITMQSIANPFVVYFLTFLGIGFLRREAVPDSRSWYLEATDAPPPICGCSLEASSTLTILWSARFGHESMEENNEQYFERKEILK